MTFTDFAAGIATITLMVYFTMFVLWLFWKLFGKIITSCVFWVTEWADEVISRNSNCGNCHKCLDHNDAKDARKGIFRFRRMILCPLCGNKRCPKASDHKLGCTRSNEPGQEGSVYS